jgi:hypothetical protein
MACNLAPCVSVVATGQTAGSVADAEKERVIKEVFQTCPEKRDAYYLGFINASANACGEQESRAPYPYNQQPDCLGLIEFKNANFAPLEEKLTPAEVENGIHWKGFITMKSSIFRVRYVYGGKWRLWGAWQDMPAGISANRDDGLRIEHAAYQNGRWSREAGPDISQIPGLLRFVTATTGIDPHADMSLDGIIKYKPACSDILSDVPHEGVHPKLHRITDTYAETSEIIKRNKENGMPDALDGYPFTSFRALPICASIGANGKCEPAGETVMVPGDLAVPTAFWQRGSPQFQVWTQRCRVPTAAVEVVLKSSGQKRLALCGVVMTLKGRREQLINAGVQIDPSEAARRSWGLR